MVPMGAVRDAGTPGCDIVPFAAADRAHRTALTEALAEHDDAILRAYVGDDVALPFERLREQLGGPDAPWRSSIRSSSDPRPEASG